MPPSVLLPVVFSSIVLVVLLTVLLGWSQQASVTPEQAIARFAIDFPGADVVDVAVTDDQRAALLWLGDQMALVMVVGARYTTRRLAPDVCTWDGTVLRVALPGFDCPTVRLPFAPELANKIKEGWRA